MSKGGGFSLVNFELQDTNTFFINLKPFVNNDLTNMSLWGQVRAYRRAVHRILKGVHNMVFSVTLKISDTGWNVCTWEIFHSVETIWTVSPNWIIKILSIVALCRCNWNSLQNLTKNTEVINFHFQHGIFSSEFNASCSYSSHYKRG
jgi:hypothetical protein